MRRVQLTTPQVSITDAESFRADEADGLCCGGPPQCLVADSRGVQQVKVGTSGTDLQNRHRRRPGCAPQEALRHPLPVPRRLGRRG